MYTIELIQRCEPFCMTDKTVVAEFQGLMGFGTLGEGGGLFATDGDKRVCLEETCPGCGQSITYVTKIKAKE